MANRVLPPHLIESNGVTCCSQCKAPFSENSKLSLSAAFRKHVVEVHNPAKLHEVTKGTTKQ